jgi:hypothetical protein
LKALIPVFHVSPPETLAAANAASAMGGVTIEMTEKYRPNRWADIFGIPSSTKAGTARIATVMYAPDVGMPIPSAIDASAMRMSVATSCPPERERTMPTIRVATPA